MTYKQVIAELEKMKNLNYSNRDPFGLNTVPSYGIGVTKIKKLAKQIKKDHDLALKMWDTPIFEGRLLSIFIENSKEVTLDQINSQIPNSQGFMLADYYCQEIIVKTEFCDDLIEKWTKSKNNHIKKSGFALLYAKAKLDKKADDEFFEPYLEQIEKELQKAENWTKESMNYALMYIGSRTKKLNKKALAIAKKIGEVKIDYGDTSCITVDAIKWMTADRVVKKLK